MLRLLFCGTPDFAVPTLRRLLAEPDFSLEAVVTQPDRPRGRGGEVEAPPVKEVALAAGVHVYQPEKIKSDSAFEFVKRVGPDAVIIIAYGQIVPARLLDIPRLGWINLHGSLLPKYRGAAPIQWAIANGESRTGLTTMCIDAGMDTGPTLLWWETAIGPDETAPELSARLAEAGADLMVETLRRYEKGEIAPQPQDHAIATIAPLLRRENGRIDWSLTAQEIYNRMRGFAPWPGAWTIFRGQMCHLWGRPVATRIAMTGAPGTIAISEGGVLAICGRGTVLRLEQIRVEGKKRIAAVEFVRGARLSAGEKFGSA